MTWWDSCENCEHAQIPLVMDNDNLKSVHCKFGVPGSRMISVSDCYFIPSRFSARDKSIPMEKELPT